jgi:GR25 family glycosyltransferase involved in LPS biosynthesis
MFISKIIVINLERAKERKRKLLESFEKIGIDKNDVLFLPAFDGDILSDSFDRKIRGGLMDRTFAKGELCCTLSHITAIKMAKSLNYKNILILEDDIVLCDDFLNKINNLEKQLPEHWQQIYIGAILDKYGEQISENLYKIISDETMMATHSYLLNNTVYDLVCDRLLEFNTATDGEYNKLHRENKLEPHVFIPLLTYQYDGYSYISNNNKQMKSMTSNFFKR